MVEKNIWTHENIKDIIFNLPSNLLAFVNVELNKDRYILQNAWTDRTQSLLDNPDRIDRYIDRVCNSYITNKDYIWARRDKIKLVKALYDKGFTKDYVDENGSFRSSYNKSLLWVGIFNFVKGYFLHFIKNLHKKGV